MVLLVLFIYICYYFNPDLILGQNTFVDIFAWIVIYYIICSFANKMNYDVYYEDFIEWAFSFIIISKLKYHHLLYLRNIHHKMHYFYKFGKIFVDFCVNEFSRTLKFLPILIEKYLYSDLDYTYEGINFLLEEYNEKYKQLVLNKLFVSFIDL